VRVDIWTDVACPHCYYTARNLVTAVSRSSKAEAIEVVWRSFQLFPQPADPLPEPPPPGRSLYDVLSAVNGSRELAKAAMDRIAPRAAAAGLEFRPDLVVPRRTMNTHRMVHLAARHHRAAEAVDRLYRAYWAEGRDLASHATLAELMRAVGGVPDGEVRDALASNEFADAVDRDRAEAAALGLSGVPGMLIDQRALVSGGAGAADLAALLDEESASRA
jgi:predicted DsbA family dithiol-disulfide isomerase